MRGEFINEYQRLNSEDQKTFCRWIWANTVVGAILLAGLIVLALKGPGDESGVTAQHATIHIQAKLPQSAPLCCPALRRQGQNGSLADDFALDPFFLFCKDNVPLVRRIVRDVAIIKFIRTDFPNPIAIKAGVKASEIRDNGTHPYDATSNEGRLHRRRKPPTNRRNAHGVRERPVRHPRSRGSRIFDDRPCVPQPRPSRPAAYCEDAQVRKLLLRTYGRSRA